MCDAAPVHPVQWAQRLKRVFQIDIESCPERRQSWHGGLRAAQEVLPACRQSMRWNLTCNRLYRGPAADREDSRPRSMASGLDRQCSARTTGRFTPDLDADLIAWATRPERRSATTRKSCHLGPACPLSADLAVTFRMVHRMWGNLSRANVPLPILV